jgi:phage terminase large subunit
VIIGVDVARFGSDKTVIAVRRGRDLETTYKYKGLDTMSVVGRVIEAIERHKPDLTVIDEGGLGAGVLDRLVEQRYKVRGVNFGSKADSSMWVNKRSEMWGTMRDWLKTASIGSDSRTSVQDDKDLKQDLVGPTYKPNSIGSIMLESKDSMKKRGLSSPDCADAVAISFAYPVSSTGRTKTEKSQVRTFVGRFASKVGDGAWMR